MENLSTSQSDEIRAAVKQAAEAHLNAKDADSALSYYAENATIISNGFLYPSLDMFATHIKEFYQTLSEINLAFWDEMQIDVLSNDHAMFSAKFRWSSTNIAGERIDLQGVWTALYARDNNRWKISHRHESFTSVPE
jgi:uncharacterized protein (TIGR02246 family)